MILFKKHIHLFLILSVMLAFGNPASFAQQENFSPFFEVTINVTDIQCGISYGYGEEGPSILLSRLGVKRITGEIVSMTNIPCPYDPAINKPDLGAAKFLKMNAKSLDFLVQLELQKVYKGVLEPFIGLKGKIAKSKGKYSSIKLKTLVKVIKDDHKDLYCIIQDHLDLELVK